MANESWTLRKLRKTLEDGRETPESLARTALARANGNASRNTYLWRDENWTLAEAKQIDDIEKSARSALWGLPVSVKDCFDLAGAPTTCGVKFYRDLNGIAAKDSWLVERIRSLGAVITGKTHLHPLAYGITGENPEYGDCLQPGRPERLTGGSSSGAAASVMEGSAVAAIGTDTGGSVRAPSALCGLAGYRATLGRGDWMGAGHLAQSFDTMGWLFRDLEDAPLLGRVFVEKANPTSNQFARFATVDPEFLTDCEPEIVAAMESVAQELEALGLRREHFSVQFWAESFEIFAPIQAWEAARIHEGHFAAFEPSIRERLEWGARINDIELRLLRERHDQFRSKMDVLFANHELLLLPASPDAELRKGADHSQTRARLLRYTTPFSLAGVPVVTIPGNAGGFQLAAARDRDESLLELAGKIGARRNLTASS